MGVALGALVLIGLAWGIKSIAESAGLGTDESAGETTPAATAPVSPTLKIVFPEGFTRKEMAARIAAVNEIALERRDVKTRLSPKAYLRLSQRGALPRDFAKAKFPNLEGFLFPATYSFTKDTTTRGLVTMQLDAFTTAWEGVDLKYAKSKNLTAYDVLIIASMVEEEVQVPKERRLVAAVIYNRLRAGTPLGIDATIRYGFDIPPTQAILESQLDSDSPYNSRKFAGLPPTPIANPGLASIQAAAHPAKVDYTFFIRKPDCRSHFFTASQEEFDNYSREGLNC
ncbi:MAG TPA: endolytic transglycosylase MltG [Gaiellaceae bacterium]|nr:endolytic transglycosylase MltG [Gaiellaceae bacterium]